MAGRLDGKVAIVTGAAQGIGQAYAERLASEGAKVALADIQGELAETNAAAIRAAGGEAIGLTVDIGDEASNEEMARRTAEELGGIDVLVSNAANYGGYVHHTLLDLPLDYWQRFLDVNLTGVLLGARAVLPYMKERGKGKIVNQSSAGADGPRNQYSVTKLGVQGITVSLARSLGQFNINVNCIAPGLTGTEATRGHYTDEELEQMVATRSLLPRLGTPEDMAGALVWLASDDSDFVTGQIIHVDGGYVVHPA
ncbi:MAG: 3-oxoacyl-[acyl-carrier protein] reductase [Gaiellaceae bacterium]|nr:3-oxoacyl-[acyl-carrier protein] reductase [Gaiellaceae bacterium]